MSKSSNLQRRHDKTDETDMNTVATAAAEAATDDEATEELRRLVTFTDAISVSVEKKADDHEATEPYLAVCTWDDEDEDADDDADEEEDDEFNELLKTPNLKPAVYFAPLTELELQRGTPVPLL
jgi:hypothetical protein